LMTLEYQDGNKKIKLSLCLTNWALRHEGVWGSGCIDPHFLDLSTNLRWVVSSTSRLLYPPPGKEPPVPIGDEVGWTPEPVWMTWRKFLTIPGLELRPLGRAARSQSLYWLRSPGSPSGVQQRRVVGRWMNVEQLVKCELAGERDAVKRNPSQCHFVHHKSHIMTWDRAQAVAVGRWWLTP
jgi:hypothetical protein